MTAGRCTRCHRIRDLARTDLCRACYQTLWRAGALPPVPEKPSHPTECTHNGRHAHGTRARYTLDLCRCTLCRAANTRDQKRSNHATRSGQRATIDAAPVIAHLELLHAAGISWRQIATTSGMSRSALSKIITGESRRVLRATAASLLAITSANPKQAPHALVDATGTRRRLQALVTLGYSIAALGKRADIDAWRVLHEDLVFEATRAAVATLYDDLSNHPPQPQTMPQRTTVTRAKRYASARGWAPPLAWDDETLDDPAATPQGVATAPVRLSVASQVDELLEIGCSVTEIPSRVGKPDLKAVINAIRDERLKAELRRRAFEISGNPALKVERRAS